MLFDLPLSPSKAASLQQLKNLQTSRYDADIEATDRSVIVTTYGSQIKIIPPHLVHGAMLLYFTRLEHRIMREAAENSQSPEEALRQAYAASTLRLPSLRKSSDYDADYFR
jgi:hypothetical protein